MNSIFAKQPKHILINYVYEYDKKELYSYSTLVMSEMHKRKFDVSEKSYNNFQQYFKGVYRNGHQHIILEIDYWINYCGKKKKLFKNHHTNRYLLQCFYNLQEKYDRGQKDFGYEVYNKIRTFMLKEKLIDEIH